MKKFLSLVLALVMTMSLVTVSAGAAEYKDLTDKDEIQYEEAVAVLNRIGIITGYTDGSFQPKKELTRGAAAKIIVSLMIGSEAASNLVAASAPYTDVPVNHTFAGVISYCKNSGYINGYQDGSFKPDGTLSGYAFSKMLLGALGYKGEYEGGFTGAGWTMNVARIGNESGLFDRLSFKGNEAVNREQACQLALNTLKGTLVEYTGGMNIVNGTQSVVVNPTRTYKTSNQEFATHINNKKSGQAGSAVDDHYTVEFGEEHFVDLRMKREASARDDFGRPSNEWSYKKVTIGTYPVEADFTFTAQVAHDVATVTDASKVRALGMDGYKVSTAVVDGVSATRLHKNGVDSNYSGTVADIADLTDNGTLVEVYVSDDVADLITDIVVVQSQLMEVKRVGSDDVTLDKVKPDTHDVTDPDYQGFNQNALHVDVLKVEVDNDNFEFLKGLKAGDEVVVVPVEIDGDYEVFKAYTPEKVEGKLTHADTYGDAKGRCTVGVTVGGTQYKSSLWNKKIAEINADSIKYTKEDVTLYLDEYGYALKAKGVGETEDFMVIKGTYQTIENGKIVTYVEGWDVKGNELSLNVGTSFDGDRFKAGDLVGYTNREAKAPADWRLLDRTAGGEVYTVATAGGYEIKASNVRISITDGQHVAEQKPYITNDVKFIFVTFDGSEVDSVEVRDGVQNVSNKDLLEKGGTNHYSAQLCLNDDGEVKAVVIKKESNSAVSSSLLYIRDWDGGYSLDNNGKKVYKYTVARMSKDGFEPKEVIWADRELEVGSFASYSATTNEGFEPFYKLKEHTDTKKTTSVVGATVRSVLNEDKGIVELANYTNPSTGNPTTTNLSSDLAGTGYIGDETNAVSMIRSEWLDLTGNSINSVEDLADFINKDGVKHEYAKIKIIYNDNPDNDGFRTVSLVVIEGFTNTQPAETIVVKPEAKPEGYSVDVEELNPAETAPGTAPKIKITGAPDDPAAAAVTSVTVKVQKSRPNEVPAGRAGLPDGITIDGDGKTAIIVCDADNGRLTVNPTTKVFTVTLSKADIASVPGSGAIIIVETKVKACTCETACADQTAGDASGCEVCDANYADCAKKTPVDPEPSGCICTEQCTEANPNQSCPVCKDDYAQCDPTPETSDLTVTVTAPSGWTATGSPYTVDGTTKKATVTLTSGTKGELTPAKKLTITNGAGWTASAATFTNGTGNSTSGTAAKFTFDVTVTGSANVEIPASALTVADDDGSSTKVTTKVSVTAQGWNLTTVNGAAYNDGTGVEVEENSTVTVVLTQATASNLAANALKGATVTASDGTNAVAVTATASTEGKAAVAAADAAIEKATGISNLDTLKGYTIAEGKKLYYGDANHTDATSLDGLTEIASPSEATGYPSLQTGTLTWYLYTPAVEAVTAQAATVTLTFTAIDGTVTIGAITAASGT